MQPSLQHTSIIVRHGLSFLAALWLAACSSEQDPLGGAQVEAQAELESGVRTWLGPSLWGNRLQDWRSAEGRIECVTPLNSKFGWLPLRTAHQLTWTVDAQAGDYQLDVDVEQLTPAKSASADALGGLLIGVGAGTMDPRSAALVHHWSGNGAGIIVGLDAGGVLHIRDNTSDQDAAEVTSEAPTGVLPEAYHLSLTIEPSESGRMLLLAQAKDPKQGQLIASCSREFEAAELSGNVALLSHPGSFRKKNTPARFGFRDLRATGPGVVPRPGGALGAILATQYTLSRGVLKLTAQLMPMGADDPRQVFLDIWWEKRWAPLSTAILEPEGWTASFRLEDWDASQASRYRVRYELPGTSGTEPLTFDWQGVIQPDPKQQEDLVVALLNCNHINSHAIGDAENLSDGPGQTKPNDWVQGMWFPHTEITQAVSARRPDLLFFAGDQIYHNASPTFPDYANIELDYLYKWYLFLWAFRDLTASTPTVTIPDDHDVFQGNVWGAGGRAAKTFAEEGGYLHPASFVRMVQRTQTAHLPDPFDPTPVQQGIGVYYTELLWGDVSFAILEDRKFKSGPLEVLPQGTQAPKPSNVQAFNPKWDVTLTDAPGLQLLGKRQESFLASWAGDEASASMKAVLSQSPLAGLSTHQGKHLQRDDVDIDANGWPQSGRRRALISMQRAHAVHLTGDQHLAIVAQHGIDKFGDGPWSFTGPAIANFYPRAWAPSLAGDYQPQAISEYTGDFIDSFGNRVSVRASANPGAFQRPESPSDLYDRMPGFGCAVFHKTSGTVTFECWPRGVDPSAADAWQYAGWPITVDPR